jgi:RNA polymerase sigma-70 factor (ECF subfamily)
LNSSRLNSDLYFFNRLKAGDEKAFDYFFNYYYSGLCIYARKYLNNRHEEEEVVQHIFLKFWQDRDVLEVNDSVASYLFQSVRNRCLDILKHKKVENKYFEKFSQTEREVFNNTWQTYIESELYSLLMDAINCLPPECRKVFIYSRFENFKNKEIAEKLNISVKTVENQISKALKVLRKQLKDYLPLLLWLSI